MMMRHTQRGFTLMELAVTVVAIGIMGTLLSNYIEVGQSVFRGNLNLKNERINQQIAEAMHEWSAINTGGLPAPYVDAPSLIYYGVMDTDSADAAAIELRNLITRRAVGLDEINDDGRASELVRVYQRVAGLTTAVPVFGVSGELATLTYDLGVIYHTQCSRFDPCNTADANDPPSDSAQLTAANYDVWAPINTDGTPGRVSTLGIQRDMLSDSMTRINIIREQLRAFFNALQTAAPPGSPDNFYPAPSDAGASLSGIGAPVHGCLDGWYQLDAADVDILPQLGLGKTEYSETVFGGRIEYCRDYDPTAADVSTRGALPHNAALRINRGVSAGAAPAATIGNNIIFSL